jgi:hypothetical protein
VVCLRADSGRAAAIQRGSHRSLEARAGGTSVGRCKKALIGRRCWRNYRDKIRSPLPVCVSGRTKANLIKIAFWDCTAARRFSEAPKLRPDACVTNITIARADTG